MSNTQNPARIADFSLEFKNRLVSHEAQAMTEFFDTYFDLIFKRVHNLIRNRQSAEDLTQDIFLKIHKGLPRFDTDKTLGPWVATIQNNHLRDYWRSQNTNRVRQNLDELNDSLAAPQASPIGDLEQKESEASLRRAIYRLPLTMRSVLLLRVFDELSFVQIGRMLELTPGAVRKRYSRALNELRELLPSMSTSMAPLAKAS